MNGESDHNITVEDGKIYLFRVISAAALSWYNLSFPGHNLSIVEVESTFTIPYQTPSIWVNAGERYSVLLNANKPGCYIVEWSMLERAGPRGRAFLKYKSQNCDHPNTTWITGYSQVPFRPGLLEPRLPDYLPDPTLNMTIAAQQIVLPDNNIKWLLNNISFMRSKTPILLAYYYNEIDFPPQTHIIEINEGDIIDITFENLARTHTNYMEQHPFHIHGHSYWVLGSGLNTDPIRKLNTRNPIKRDTFTMPHNGWVTIRMVADNPGVWILHCHVTWHVQMGMSLLFAYPQHTIPAPPYNFPVCGNITRHLRRKELRDMWIGIYSLICFNLLAIFVVLFYRAQLKDFIMPEEDTPLVRTKDRKSVV